MRLPTWLSLGIKSEYASIPSQPQTDQQDYYPLLKLGPANLPAAALIITFEFALSWASAYQR
jgi:hypothetical protein